MHLPHMPTPHFIRFSSERITLSGGNASSSSTGKVYFIIMGGPQVITIVFFAAGPRVEESTRPVNVQDWDVALHVVFDSKDLHDKYQDADDHHKFIDENKQNWKSVRVFDSFIAEK